MHIASQSIELFFICNSIRNNINLSKIKERNLLNYSIIIKAWTMPVIAVFHDAPAESKTAV